MIAFDGLSRVGKCLRRSLAVTLTIASTLAAASVSAQQGDTSAATPVLRPGQPPSASPVLEDAQRPPAPQPPVQAAPGPRAAPIPDQYRLNMMIRSTILALNHANLTGNYTVLRDLGAPGFQVANNAARLAEIFAPMRARKLDLTPILFFNPQLAQPPAVQDERFLRLTGFFATQPEQVNFDLAFQAWAGQWMLAGISVRTAPADPQRTGATSALPSPPAAAAARPASPAATETQQSQGAAGAGPKPVRIDLSEPAPLPERRPRTQPAPRSAAAQTPRAVEAEPVEENARASGGGETPAGVPTGGWSPR